MRLQVKRALPIYWLDEDTVRIGAQQGITQELRDYAGELRSLLPLLDGTREMDELLHEAGIALPSLTAEQLRAGMALLDDCGLLEDASLYDHLPEKLHANQAFFAAAAANTGSPSNMAQGRISDSHVLLLGLGGGGSASVPSLLALGVKKLTIVDYDIVESSNLNRQTLYRTKDVGRFKVDVAAEYADAFAPDVSVSAFNQRISCVESVTSWPSSVDDVKRLGADADAILCAIDEPPFVAQRRVNAAAVALGVPAVFLLSQHTRGRVFSVVPGLSGCMDCLQIHDEVSTEDFLPQYRALMSPERVGATAALAPHIQRLVSFGTDEIVRLITQYAAPFAAGKQMEVDYLTGNLGTVMEWEREPGCPTCGERDARYDHIFEIAPL